MDCRHVRAQGQGTHNRVSNHNCRYIWYTERFVTWSRLCEAPPFQPHTLTCRSCIRPFTRVLMAAMAALSDATSCLSLSSCDWADSWLLRPDLCPDSSCVSSAWQAWVVQQIQVILM